MITTGFSIYLLAQNAAPQQLAILSQLELETTPLLSIDDIVSYKKATHEIQLTEPGFERVQGLSVPVNGRAFAVCVDGQPIYAGAFWVAYSSLSFDGVVIDTTRATEENPVIQIQLGYPGPAFFHGDDPRSDPRILQALEQAGRLIQGPDAWRASYEKFFSGSFVCTSLTCLGREVSASGDMAWDYGTFVSTFEGPGARTESEGKFLQVWKKVDGKWKGAAVSIG